MGHVETFGIVTKASVWRTYISGAVVYTCARKVFKEGSYLTTSKTHAVLLLSTFSLSAFHAPATGAAATSLYI